MIQVEYFDIFKGGEGRDQGCSTSCPASGWPNNFKFKFFKQQIQVVKKTNTNIASIKILIFQRNKCNIFEDIKSNIFQQQTQRAMAAEAEAAREARAKAIQVFFCKSHDWEKSPISIKRKT